MKKIALILALILVLGCAYAEPQLIGQYKNVRYVSDTNLMLVAGENGYALADFDNNLVTDDIYSSSFMYYDGLITGALYDSEGPNDEGAMTPDGTVVIPFQYGDIKTFESDFAAGIAFAKASSDNYDYESWGSDTTTYYLIDYVDFYNLITGATMRVTRSQYMDACELGHTLNIENRATGEVTAYDANFNVLGTGLNSIYSDDYAQKDVSTFRENRRTGLSDGNGTVLIKATYDYISDFYGDYAEVDLEDKVGLIDCAGNEILPPVYDSVERGYYLPKTEGNYGYSSSGYFCVVKDGKMGYATASGVTCEPKYSESIMENNGASALFTDMEGKANIMAADGVYTQLSDVNPEYIRAAENGSGFYYTVRDDDYNYGLIDWHGNVIFPCEYESIDITGDGQYAVVEPEYMVYEVYQLAEAVAAVAEAPAAEVPAEAPVAAAPAAPAAEAPQAAAPAAPAAAPAADTSAAKALLEGAKALLAADAAANAAAASTLLDNVSAMLAGNPAATILDGVKALLATDAATNAGAIITLMDSAISML